MHWLRKPPRCGSPSRGIGTSGLAFSSQGSLKIHTLVRAAAPLMHPCGLGPECCCDVRSDLHQEVRRDRR